jgi:cation/acetate symporter
LIGSLVLIGVSPSLMGPGKFINAAKPLFPLENVGILSVPIGFIGAWIGTMLGKEEHFSEAKFVELEVRANTGLGAEKATAAGH